MWCYAIGVEAVVLRSWCVVLCTVCPKYLMSRLYTVEWNFPEDVSMNCLLFDNIDLQNTATNDVTTLNFSRYVILLSSSHSKL